MTNKYFIIGRFQPFHNGHMELVYKVLEDMKQELVIFIGSSNESRTNRNPFTFFERKAMIKSAIYDELGIHYGYGYTIEPLPDTEDNLSWVEGIRQGLNPKENDTLYFVHCNKDEDTTKNNEIVLFELGSESIKHTPTQVLNATDIREVLRTSDWKSLNHKVPYTVLQDLFDIYIDL